MKRYRCVLKADGTLITMEIEVLAHSGEAALCAATRYRADEVFRKIEIWDETGLVFVRQSPRPDQKDGAV